ncbi:penicillin-binding transpeptidase domain-containing protein [Terrabacter aerolatus]|uniref:Cell division protein FtsI n=1 Tax=Terrabacter aerolatus TaxID=422442 RepID=A0A512CWQ0_9MICO|nr:penicillin-binding transpeptidase domain-containing protein [Terrabacter aerolatus]GEO28625.1 cell division protein FtsI [Terrabacter aerolatus]
MLRGSRARTLVAVSLSGVLVGTLAAGCSMFDSPPDPDDAARALAAGLASGDLGAVTFKGTTPARATAFVTAAYKDLGTLRPQVSVSELSHSDGSDRATATLLSRWDVSTSPTDWTYKTQVNLSLVDATWQVSWTPGIVAPQLASDETLDIVRKWPQRADIVDTSGAKIMTEREVAAVGIDKTKVSGAEATAAAKKLATLVEIDPARFAAKVGAAGPKAFVEGVTLRATDPLLQRNGPAIAKVKGALTVPAMQVLGPSRTFAAPILGTVGEATAEQIKASKGTLEAGDTVGMTGLQYRYDAQLRGTPGLAVQAVRRGADGSVLDKRELFAEQSTDGKPLTITLDQKAQAAAEAALAQQTQHPTALVVVRVSTGEVLAAAVGPAANGSTLALAGKEAPGSTFKIVSSLANVRKGFTADTKLPCTPTLTVNGRQFANYTTYPAKHLGDIPMRIALAYSCNTAFISQHDKVSQQDLVTAAQSLGMGEKLDLPFTGFLGSVPPTDDAVEHAASFIGQGRVEASPLTMALVVASVMKGQTVRPQLVAGLPALPQPATPLDPAEAGVLRTEMRTVVSEGSGTVLKPLGVEYAKTGTAEFGTKNPPDTHVWMVAGRGDIAIAAYNEVGDNGVTGAAPFIISFLKADNLR